MAAVDSITARASTDKPSSQSRDWSWVGGCIRLEPDYPGQLAEQAARVEVFARDLARRPRVARVIRGDRAQRLDRLGVVGESHQSGAGRDELFKPGELGHRRPPGREIADRAVAEPSRMRADVEILGDREFAARGTDVAAVGIDIER